MFKFAQVAFLACGYLKVSINIFLRTSVQMCVAAAFVPESQIHMAGKRGSVAALSCAHSVVNTWRPCSSLTLPGVLFQ